MAIALKQSTASQEVPLGYFVDSTDGNTEETGLTIANTDIKVWKAGATTLANKTSGGATHIANGVYSCVLDATDTDTVGPLILFVHVAGALAVRVECVVLAATVYDAGIGATITATANVTQWSGTNVATVDTAGYPKVTIKDGTGTGELDTASGKVAIATGGIVAASFAADAIDAAAIANGAIDAATFAAGAIDAAAIAANAIGASELAADAATEIATAVLAAATATPIAADIQAVNAVPLVGDGAATPWGP